MLPTFLELIKIRAEFKYYVVLCLLVGTYLFSVYNRRNNKLE